MRREDARPEHFEATRRALSEVSGILEDFPQAVIVGGNVPYLLVPQDRDPHEGTVDIDVVLDRNGLGSESDWTLHEHLMRADFQQDKKRPFRFEKYIDGLPVLLELLAGGEPAQDSLDYIASEDIYVSILEGMEVALKKPVEITLADGCVVRAASIPAFFAMKATALEKRDPSKIAKDAYDIVYCLRNYPGGLEAIVQTYRPFEDQPFVEPSLRLLAALFAKDSSLGPVAYASRGHEEDRALLAREARERVNDLLDRLP